MKDHTTQRTLSLVGIYLLCRFVYLPLQRLIPYYFLGRGLLPKTAFFLLALLLVSRWVSEVPLSPARLFFFTILAYAADNLGETARDLDIDPISVLLVAWLFLTLLVYQRELPLSRWEFVQVFLSPGRWPPWLFGSPPSGFTLNPLEQAMWRFWSSRQTAFSPTWIC